MARTASRFLVVGDVGSGAGVLSTWLSYCDGIACNFDFHPTPEAMVDAPMAILLKHACGAESVAGVRLQYNWLDCLWMGDPLPFPIIHVARNPIDCFVVHQERLGAPVSPALVSPESVTAFVRRHRRCRDIAAGQARTTIPTEMLRYDPRGACQQALTALGQSAQLVPVWLTGPVSSTAPRKERLLSLRQRLPPDVAEWLDRGDL